MSYLTPGGAKPGCLRLSLFSDELNRPGRPPLTHEQVLAAMEALGVRSYNLRTLTVGGAQVPAMAAWGTTEGREEIARIAALDRDHGVIVDCLGTAIGKCRIVNEVDVNRAPYRSIADERALCEVAGALAEACGGVPLARIFSGYPPSDTPIERYGDYLAQSVDRLGAVINQLAAYGIVAAIEHERGMVGCNGYWMRELFTQLGSRSAIAVLDPANLSSSGWLDVLGEVSQMAPWLGMLHVKAYSPEGPVPSTPGAFVDEDQLSHFVPCTMGRENWADLFIWLKGQFPAMAARVGEFGISSVSAVIEGHLRRGGQFGGMSGIDGVALALEAFVSRLNTCGVQHDRWTFANLLADRDGATQA